eukprot:2809943-Amphidinium_carterae.1
MKWKIGEPSLKYIQHGREHHSTVARMCDVLFQREARAAVRHNTLALCASQITHSPRINKKMRDRITSAQQASNSWTKICLRAHAEDAVRLLRSFCTNVIP